MSIPKRSSRRAQAEKEPKRSSRNATEKEKPKRSSRQTPDEEKPNQSSRQIPAEERPNYLLITAIIAAFGVVIAAVISYFGAVNQVLLPIEATQTAEAFHTSIALTSHAAEVLNTSIAMTTQAQLFVSTPTVTETLVPSITPSITPSFTPKPTQTQIPSPTKTPTITPLPPYANGGLTRDGCISTTYWYQDPNLKPASGNCFNLSASGLFAEDKSLRINVEKMSPVEKTLFMNIPNYENIDVSFSAQVKRIDDNPGAKLTKLAVGICESDKYRSEHIFVYYYFYVGKPTIALTINGFNNPSPNYYYEYSGGKQDFKFSLHSHDLSVYVGGVQKVDSQFVKRTENAAICLYYTAPEGGIINATIYNLLVEKK